MRGGRETAKRQTSIKGVQLCFSNVVLYLILANIGARNITRPQIGRGSSIFPQKEKRGDKITKKTRQQNSFLPFWTCPQVHFSSDTPFLLFKKILLYPLGRHPEYNNRTRPPCIYSVCTHKNSSTHTSRHLTTTKKPPPFFLNPITWMAACFFFVRSFLQRAAPSPSPERAFQSCGSGSCRADANPMDPSSRLKTV